MKFRWSLAVGLGWSTAIFGIVNYLNFVQRPACFDCGFSRGVPFALSYDAGFNDVGRNAVDRILWTGVLIDALFVLASGFALAWMIHIAAGRFGAQRTS
jgi:hypothetical protein